ncbi:MAG: DUF1292 domain-containing protein [Clostridia bacterium]|nr:DUF1292 domain-containing protein [Clostridia bacterium]
MEKKKLDELEDEVEILDENEDCIMTFEDENGKLIDYVLIAEFPYKEGYYFLVQPKELPEGMADDEAMVFEVIDYEDDEDYVVRPVEDDNLVDEVFAEYNRIWKVVDDSDK